jgi:parallel beta-helix repeat protein
MMVSGEIINVDVNGNGNFTTIQNAINNSKDGDIIHVWEGIYNESIVINKSITLIGNGSANTNIAGNSSGDIITITANWVNISGFNLTNRNNNYGGIKVIDSENISIFDNSINNNNYGIKLENSNYCKIINNNVSSNIVTGILITNSSYNKLINNNANNNFDGITLSSYSNNNKIVNNICSLNINNGITNQYFSDRNIIKNNTCMDNDYGIFLKESDYNNISINNCSGNSAGIIIYNRAKFNSIFNNNCNENINGIVMYYYCTQNNITNNKFNQNEFYGIVISYISSLIIINSNICNNNGVHGILITDSRNITLTNNTCSNNSQIGIILIDSISIKMANNKMYSCGLFIDSDFIHNWNSHDIDITNLVNNKPLYYWKNVNSNTVPSDAGQIILVNCSNTIVKDQEIDNASVGVIIGFSNNIQLRNNQISNNSFYGIYQLRSYSNTLSNNYCISNQEYGIYLKRGLEDIITSNYCDSNAIGGIMLYSCLDSVIDNNTCIKNDQGIKLVVSYSCELIDNFCITNNNGLFLELSNENIIRDNICNKNEKGIDIYYSDSNRIIRNICGNNYFEGIVLRGSIKNNITDNVCSFNYIGIEAGYQSDKNYFYNNTCKFNNGHGIDIDDSMECILVNNICSYNSWYGIVIYMQDHYVGYNNCSNNNGSGIRLYSSVTTVDNNYCYNNKGYGIYLNDDINNIKNNNCSYNLNNGIYLTSSNENIIENNTCTYNQVNGIFQTWSRQNIIDNNICSFNNDSGISFDRSDNNLIKDNNCSFNNKSNGIYLRSSISNEVINNSIFKNIIGLNLEINSNDNKIEFNNIKNNRNGISISGKTKNNLIFRNSIINNSNIGISLGPDSNSTLVQYNNFIQNGIQAFDMGENSWYRSAQGNYWSDYTGLDNGANGREFNDGIGDTEIPHLNLDYYPFMNKNSWLAPNAPELTGPKSVDTDGIFDLKWTCNKELTGFIIEEAESVLFEAPVRIYHGILDPYNVDNSDLKYNITITDKFDGTYYYRVLGYTDQYRTIWSNIIGIKVDLTPVVPKNLTANVWPNGKILNLSWEPLNDKISNYEIYFKTTDNWSFLANISHPDNYFNHTGLTDLVLHYYKIRAWNIFNKSSPFSSQIMGIPMDSIPPNIPTGFRIGKTIGHSINLSWNRTLDYDVVGYNLYRNIIQNKTTLSEPINGDELINDIFYNDTSIDHSVSYYYSVTAVDDAGLESNFSIILEVLTLQENYHFPPPMVRNNQGNFSIEEDTIDNHTINLHDWFYDAAGEELQFRYFGNEKINVYINNETGMVILTPEPDWNGQEAIIFYAWDGFYEAMDDVVITVTPINDPPRFPSIISPKDGKIIEYGVPLDFHAKCFDADLPYGDQLTFSWVSDISDLIGVGERLDDVKLPEGIHKITLIVSDSENQRVRTTINVTVEKLEDEEVSDDLMSYFTFIGVIFFVILLFIIIFINIRRRHLRAEYEDFEDVEEIEDSEDSVMLAGDERKQILEE